MLILTRKLGESVYIGDDIKITLMEIKGNQVRVGVQAPSSVRIYREEIYLQILEENKRAAAETPTDTNLADVARAWKSSQESASDRPQISKLKPAEDKGKKK